MKLFREVLDDLYITYADYLKVLKEKIKWFSNVTPDRIEQLTLAEYEHMCEIVPHLTSPSLLFTEFQLITDQVKECVDMNGVIKLLQKCGHLYPRLSRVYNFILTLPVSVASNERGFSKMKRIKNYLRSNLTNEKLEFLLLCSVERDLIEELDLSVLASAWVSYHPYTFFHFGILSRRE